MKLLQNKVCVITGGGSKRGLGRAMAKLFHEHGAKIALLDIDEAAAIEAAALVGGKAYKCDVSDRASCEAAVKALLKDFGTVDVLVNNAGITSPQRLLEVDTLTYDRVMDINMRGTYHMTQAVAPSMIAQKAGSIVNLSSVSAQKGGGVFGGSHYAAAKAAILGYTKATARELGEFNIRANAICASMIDTDITGGLVTAERKIEILKSIPMGRLGEAHEVAGCALFLACDLSSYVSGSELDINGASHIH
jgi:NAD(P)-dependent dehydrogenase (short-subunit alcohol dehydrogenase family)